MGPTRPPGAECFVGGAGVIVASTGPKETGDMDDQGNGRRITTRFNGVKIFSATVAHDREALGDKVTAWIRNNPQKEVVETVVTQSSDEAFHCIAITLFFWQQGITEAAADR